MDKKMKTKHLARLSRALAFSCALLSGLATANAIVQYEFTGTGTSAGVPVSATADFVLTTGKIVLTLENTTPHTADAGQLLTGIRFSLANGSTYITNASLLSAFAIPRTVNAGGSYSDGAQVSILGTWEKVASGTGYQLDFNPNAEYAIIGPADGEGGSPNKYTANGSILGNPGHNPFTAKIATFTLTSASILETSTISAVEFIYNTGLSYSTPGIPTDNPPPPIPEPTTMLFGGALLGVMGFARRRSR